MDFQEMQYCNHGSSTLNTFPKCLFGGENTKLNIYFNFVRNFEFLNSELQKIYSLSRGPHKVLPMCSRLSGRLSSDETPGVSSLECALVAVRACLLVLLCCVHHTTFLTPYLPYCRT
jgi:hypothetical protein